MNNQLNLRIFDGFVWLKSDHLAFFKTLIIDLIVWNINQYNCDEKTLLFHEFDILKIVRIKNNGSKYV